ncbi:MAG: DUF2116 family Zn-ribbon domain-containing protein [Promethearchaeota archaeon]
MSKSYKFKKYQKTDSDIKIIPHKHCPVCGRQIYDLELLYCSDACKDLAENKEKKKKKKMWRYIIIMTSAFVGFIVIFAILGYFLK